MKSYSEIGLRSFWLKVVRGKLKAGCYKVLPDLSFLLSTRPIRWEGVSTWRGLEDGARAGSTVQKPAWSALLSIRQRGKPSVLNFKRKCLQGTDFDVEEGKANVPPDYYRKPGSGKDDSRHSGVSYQENNHERREDPKGQERGREGTEPSWGTVGESSPGRVLRGLSRENWEKQEHGEGDFKGEGGSQRRVPGRSWAPLESAEPDPLQCSRGKKRARELRAKGKQQRSSPGQQGYKRRGRK